MTDETTASPRPRFATKLLAASEEERKARLSLTHSAYILNKHSWDVLLDAFEGSGGFLDGSYLWPHPREEQADFDKRCAMARYHNYLEALVDLYVRFMFTQGVRRDSKSEEYNAWLEDVDGAGTSIDDFLKKFASVALVNGHAGMLVDKTADEPDGPTKAEEKARPVASIFTAPHIADWRFKSNRLSAVKLFEAAPEGDITQAPTTGTQYLLWDGEGWARFDAEGNLIASGTPNLGIVPLVILRPKPSQLNAMLGRALVSNANVVVALFNRASEEDEVLRTQAFSVLTCEVGPEGNVEEAKASLGSVIGTARALVAKGQLKYETPDQNVPMTIRDNIAYLVQEIYRAAHVRYKREGLAAESGESIRLQYTELNEMLQGFSKAMSQAESEMARCYFAWQEADETAAQAAFEKAQPVATYPDEFFLDALIDDLTAWAEALAMNLGETMAKRIKKKAVRRVDTEIPPDELKKIDAEIDAMTTEELVPSLIPPIPPDRGGDVEGDGIKKAGRELSNAA